MIKSEIQLIGFEKEEFAIVGESGWTIKRETLDESLIERGLDPSINAWRLSGQVYSNKRKSIAKIVIDAPFGEHFTTVPYIITDFKNNIFLKPIKVFKTNNKITSYGFAIIYKNNTETTKVDALKASIKYETKTIVTRSITIDKINFGSNIIKSTGETREMKVYGAPTATFGIAINENFVETVEGEKYFEKVSDKPLVKKKEAEGRSEELFKKDLRKNLGLSQVDSATFNYGQDVNIIKGTIDSTGVFSFNQKFPSNIVLKTLVNGAKSSTATIVFDKTTDVKVGDRIYASSIPTSTPITVSTVNADGVTLVLDTAITIADNIGVKFKRVRSYSVDIVPDLTSTLGPNMPVVDPLFRLSQPMDPILTIRHAVPSGMKLTHSSIVGLVPPTTATGLGDGGDFDILFPGKVNLLGSSLTNKLKSRATITLLYDLNDGAEVFSAVKAPVFNFKDGTNSNWTNVLSSENGGTKISINNISYETAVGLNTIVLKYEINIIKWGTEDVTMVLDIEDFSTIA